MPPARPSVSMEVSMSTALTVIAYQGDAGGTTVNRHPHQILLTVHYTDTGDPLLDLDTLFGGGGTNIQVAPMTQGLTGTATVVAVQPRDAPDAYIIHIGVPASWTAGV